MNCERARENITGHRLGMLTEIEEEELIRHLEGCAGCRAELAETQRFSEMLASLPEPSPSVRLREQFYAMLDTHDPADEPRRRRSAAKLAPVERMRAVVYWMAPRFGLAAALLVIGFLVGERMGLQKAASVPPAERAELAELKRKVDEMDRFVVSTIGQQNSSGERLRQVLSIANKEKPDRWMLVDVVGTLAFEPSPNIRLEMVEGLAPHAAQSVVTAGLRSALRRENAPLVQLAMIELLAGSRDSAAVPVLDYLAVDRNVDATVREAARRAVSVISSATPPLTPPPASTKPSPSPSGRPSVRL